MIQTAEKSLNPVLEKARVNLVAYRKVLLGVGEGEVRSAPFHHTWSDLLLNGTENVAIEGFRESAKALSLDTQIPTPKGFKPISSVLVGDKVFDEKGNICCVTAISEVFKGHDCYDVVFSDHTKVTADAGHIWRVKNKHARKYQNLTTEQLIKKGIIVGNTRKDGYVEYAFAVDVAGAIKTREKRLSIDPYLLGLWLGDGSTRGADITVGDDAFTETLKLITDKWDKVSIYAYKNRAKRVALIGGFVGLLKKEKLYGHKHIPEKYLRGSIEQRLELLRGIVDSDGTVAISESKRGTVTISTVKENLKDDYVSLVSSLGIKATSIKGKAKINGRVVGDHYRVSFKTDKKVCRLTKKVSRQSKQHGRSRQRSIVRIDKVDSVPTKCIAVDSNSNLFLITDRFIPTHNTQLALRAFLLYAFTFPDESRDYIVLIKKNATLARAKIKEIEREYATNPLISGNKVKIRDESGDVFSVDVMHEGKVRNVRIEAYGKGASVRGLANVDRRPKVVIIDDPQDVEDARSETVTETDWNWFLSDVMFLGKSSRIFLIGNNLGERCIVERIFAMEGKLEQIAFKTMRVPIINEQGLSTWAARYDVKDILKEKADYMKLGKLDIWLRERMCQSVDDELRIFNPSDYRYYPHTTIDKIMAECNRVGVLDPASSTEKSACYRAIVVAGCDCDNNWFVADVPYGRWDSVEMIDQIFASVQKWGLKEFGIEKGIFKQVLEPFIYKEMAHRNIFFNIFPIEHAKVGSKLERIKMLQPRFHAHRIWFPEQAPWLAELRGELSGITKDAIKSLHVDLVDAMAMLGQVMKVPGKKQTAFERKMSAPEPVEFARLI